MVEIERAGEADADEIATLIRNVITISNAADYSDEIIRRIVGGFSGDAMRRRISSSFVIVARTERSIVGTGTLDGDQMRSLFVDPLVQRRRIGSMISEVIESEARDRSVEALRVQSSLTARAFYEARGYALVAEAVRDDEPIVLMSKALLPAQEVPT